MADTNTFTNQRIKQILDDIIDVAYSDESEYMRDKYKSFTLQIENDYKQSKNGDYDQRYCRIRVGNLFRGTGDIAKTCLHELAHHIDLKQNGRTGHQKPFYMAYRRLIYASLDMGITKKFDFDTVGASDSNKVYKMVEEYIPHPINYVLPTEKTIRCKNCYEQKEQLKENGFKWNKLEQVWERKCVDEDADILLMKELGVSDYTIGQRGIYVEAVIYIYAKGKTYNSREVLKALGFFYNADEKMWLKKTEADDVTKEIQELQTNKRLSGIEFGFFKR